jgi:hypothetical protein
LFFKQVTGMPVVLFNLSCAIYRLHLHRSLGNLVEIFPN